MKMIFRKFNAANIGIHGIKALFSIIFCLLFFSCATINVPKYDVEIEAAEEKITFQDKNETAEKAGKIRIVHISDFHSNDFGKEEKNLIEKIKNEAPDLIVMTGDIFDYEMKEPKPLKNVEYLLDGIKSLCPVYYVSGNHEFYDLSRNDFEEVLTEKGVNILKDEIDILNLNDGNIIIAGLSDPQAVLKIHPEYHSADKIANYKKNINLISEKTKLAVAEHESSDKILFTLLLAHRPEYIDDYISPGVFDLILSGHAHGGQWRIPGLINGIYAPGQGYFPKYAGGRFDFYSNSKKTKNTVFIVSRGLSHQAPNIPRFFNGLELVVIDIIFKK